MSRIKFTSSFTVVMLLALMLSISHLQAAALQTYIVLYANHATPADVASIIARAGGTVVHSYSQIGVVIVQSDIRTFRRSLLASNSGILGAAATAPFGAYLNDDHAAGAGQPALTVTANAAGPGGDTLSGLQWDMDQIYAPQARAIFGGSPAVVVGDIDTGIDFMHPDLAPNVDFANSVSCLSGAPDPNPSAWRDDNGHGTHTAGLIAAAKNGFGIIGVAPNTRIAAIKASNDAGLFSPEAVVCAFMWAGTRQLPVINTSYRADPRFFNCQSDSRQRVVWEAVRRAIRFAVQNGTVVISAAGNYSEDLAQPNRLVTSLDGPAPLARSIQNQNDCAVVPVGIPGVIGVAANGNRQLKSFYSSYGERFTQVVAPGGDSILQSTAAAPNGRVLSTWPASLETSCLRQVSDCSVSPCALYCYLQGTSMASAHVAGVAALIVSNGATRPDEVAARIQDKADPLACPDLPVYDVYSIGKRAPQVCQGDASHNSFSGHGQVNALRAVSP
jgi:subtilisin family serine protease